MTPASFTPALLLGLGLEAAIGWPGPLYRRIGHPVTWIGVAISVLDRKLNRENAAPALRRAAGVLCLLLVVGVAAACAIIAEAALPSGWRGRAFGALLAWPFIAARSLYTHVGAVATPLKAGDLEAARRACAMIVGRDTENLDEGGVARAALESLSENASDGVVAPLFWGAVAGLPGLVGYKALNTLDSMVGHRTPRFEAFGWASARADDVANFVPARLTALLFALAAPPKAAAFSVMFRDARAHRSPNAGWPESAFAAALGVRLSGPRAYAGRIKDEPWLNPGGRDPDAADLAAGLALYLRTMLLAAGLLAVLAAGSIA
ncbi:adenosylcobinamide-phosphate synthase CbiB [Rhodoblastus sp.]|uniref:adenosylcobinamide-phosphate synthase CbiB n=1 Tax=Rhodoblastus sp. TaxID=1962975 RepID=UPI0026259D1C|nr:adenosylcobinamide-phosphate synthase CbiB [Rhodoblastus sp.]